jgi:membrane-associated protease RseP (regulator of RpoE activity)
MIKRMRSTGGMQCFLICWGLWFGLMVLHGEAFGQPPNENMTNEKALILAEQFGIDVGEVDEEVKKILGLTKAEGVVVYAVIGGSPAELSGIKVKAIIKEVDKYEIHTLVDLGTALEQTLPTKNFTVATYEPADPDNQGVTGGLNFHFVRILQD